MDRTAHRWIGRSRKQWCVGVLLASFVCLPAHCQDVQHIANRAVAPLASSRFGGEIYLLMRGGTCCATTSPDSNSRRSGASRGAFKEATRRIANDQAELYSAPFHISNLKWDALFLGGTGALIATDRQASRALPGSHLNLSRNISNAGLYGTSAAAGILWLSSLATHDEHARETGELGAEALVNALPVYVGLQFITGRERPTEGSGNGRFWKNNALNSSFPSGHAVFTWTMASVIAHEYPRPWIKWLVYGTATAVSVTRFTGREHFPSDVVAGSAIGYLIGRQIFHAHCRERIKRGLSHSQDCGGGPAMNNFDSRSRHSNQFD